MKNLAQKTLQIANSNQISARDCCCRTRNGNDIKAGKVLCLVDQIDELHGERWFAPAFLFARFTGEPRFPEPHKHDGLAWFPLDARPDALTRSTIMPLGPVVPR